MIGQTRILLSLMQVIPLTPTRRTLRISRLQSMITFTLDPYPKLLALQ